MTGCRGFLILLLLFTESVCIADDQQAPDEAEKPVPTSSSGMSAEEIAKEAHNPLSAA